MSAVKVCVWVEVTTEDGAPVLPSVAAPEAVRAIREAVEHTYNERGFCTVNPVFIRIVSVDEVEPTD